MTLPYYDSIVFMVDKHNQHLGKICNVCGETYEEHSYINKFCPNYDNEYHDNFLEEERKTGRWLNTKFTEKLCQSCEHNAEIPYEIFKNDDYFICKKRKTIEQYLERSHELSHGCEFFNERNE